MVSREISANKQICFCNFNLKNTQGKEHKLIIKDLIKQLRELGFFFMRKVTKKSFIYKNFLEDIKLNNLNLYLIVCRSEAKVNKKDIIFFIYKKKFTFSVWWHIFK